MPLGGADGLQFQFAQQTIAKALKNRSIAEAGRRATDCLDDPLDADEGRDGELRYGWS